MSHDDLDRAEFLSTPAFWGMYYFMLLDIGDSAAAEWAEPLFGTSHEEVSRLHRESFEIDDPPWPYIHVPLAGGFGVRIEFGDDGERYWLHSPQAEPLDLGQTGAAPELPAFRWAEIERISAFLRSTPTNAITAEASLLLLLPAADLGANDDHYSVEQKLRLAWKEMGVAREEGIGTLVARSMTAATSAVRWRNDPRHGWVNDGEHSRRNPSRIVKPCTAEQFMLIRRFVDSIDLG